MTQEDQSMKKEDWEKMKKDVGCIFLDRKKIENDPRLRLRKIIHQMKVENIVNNFARKISMNNVEREPVDFTPFDEKIDRSEEMNGVEIPSLLLNIFYIISIINTVVMWIIASMSVIFTEATTSK